jgi:hypothetical protein
MNISSTGGWYALRRTMPPWGFDVLLEELVETAPRYGLDELILIVDTEEFSHGYPSLEWLTDYQQMMFRAKAAMEAIGVRYSLNPWITLGHADRGRPVAAGLPGMQPIVHADGTEASDMCCFLCESWQDYTRAAWHLYAETEPGVIWIEDDCRGFGDHACYCPLHMARFSAAVGQHVERESLVAAIFQSGAAHPWRKVWLETQGRVVEETMGFLAGVVRAVSPGSSLGLMSSGPRNHCMEGRNWRRLADALGEGGSPVYSRPTLGNYWEYDLRGYYFSQDSIKITRYCLPDSVVDQTEIENVPFGPYASSLSSTALKILLSFGYGAQGVTLNVFDHLGHGMETEPAYGRLLARMKPRLSALAELTQQPGTYRGVQLLHHDGAALHRRLAPGAEAADLRGEGEGLMQALEGCGVPTTYGDEPVVALCGQQPDLLSDDELAALLAKGLFLDGPAARIMVERGFGEQIGIASVSSPQMLIDVGAVSAEELCEGEDDPGGQRFMTCLLPTVNYEAQLCRLAPVSSAVVKSRLVDPNRETIGPQMVAFENALGGRVVVHGWDYATAIGQAYFSTLRARQMRGVADWLFRGRSPLSATVEGGWPLVFRKDCDGYSVVGLHNLSLDPYLDVTLRGAFEQGVSRVCVLGDDGAWQVSDHVDLRGGDHGCVCIRCRQRITRDRPLFLFLPSGSDQTRPI